jgi:hypothetical protein
MANSTKLATSTSAKPMPITPFSLDFSMLFSPLFYITYPRDNSPSDG